MSWGGLDTVHPRQENGLTDQPAFLVLAVWDKPRWLVCRKAGFTFVAQITPPSPGPFQGCSVCGAEVLRPSETEERSGIQRAAEQKVESLVLWFRRVLSGLIKPGTRGP